MQGYFTAVATAYEKMGFRAPELRLVNGLSGVEASQVNLFDYDDAGLKPQREITVLMI